MSDSHWVEDLYPAHFTYKDYDQLTQPIGEVRTMLDKLLDRVTRVDTDSIRDIYINVLAMVTAQERASSNPITRMVNSSTQTDISALMTKSLSVTAQTSGAEDLKGKSLWTSMEHEMLRDHYVKQHEEYLATRTELLATRADEARFEEKCQQACSDLAKKEDQLSSKDADLSRLRAVNASLRDEIVRIMRQLKDRQAELKDLTQRYNLKASEAAKTSAEINDLSIKHKLLKVKLDSVHEEAAVEADRKITAIKLQCDKEVADLTDRINNLTESLDVERELHSRCKQGLEVLRLHYSHSNAVQALVNKK
ncbi:coiled-coil domain-containing protein 160 homolog [Watersipora subatra]|uniref:coiled-coil domain-containing protein 160 homolog n=1 Tax=Watersipora subatra TaxID=2589382 RepID=UPI00355C0048